MCGYDGVFVFVACGDELDEELEEFVDLGLGKVGVVAGVFYFKSVDVFAFSSHEVWQGVEAWIADGDTYGVVAFFLQEFD